MPQFFRKLFVPLWFSFLFLPFKGVKGSLVLFLALGFSAYAIGALSGPVRKLRASVTPIRMPSVSAKGAWILIILFALILPLFATDYVIDVAILVGIYVILAEGLNVVVGLTGLLNLGYAAFYAVGAYSYALLTTRAGFGFWSALPFSMGLSALAGFLLSVPALRLRGDYLAIVSLGFGEITRLVLNNWDGLTNGPNGISGIPRPSIAGFHLDGLKEYYFLVLLMAALSMLVIRNVFRSKTGRAWVAIREDEIAASASGLNTTAYKFYSLTFGAFWAGLGGALFASKMGFISPESFTFMESVLIVCMVILGGLGSIAGAALGAVMLVGLPELLREFQQYRMLVLGAGLVVLMVFRPQGLLGGKSVSS